MDEERQGAPAKGGAHEPIQDSRNSVLSAVRVVIVALLATASAALILYSGLFIVLVVVFPTHVSMGFVVNIAALITTSICPMLLMAMILNPKRRRDLAKAFFVILAIAVLLWIFFGLMLQYQLI